VEIGNLRNLAGFDCSNNQLTSLPVEIGDLSNLILLNCENNKLTSLPVEFAKLSDHSILTDLDLKIQERNWVMEKTIEVAQNKETMLEFMKGVELGRGFVMSLKGSNMFLIHFDKQSITDSPSYVRIFFHFLEFPEHSSFEFIRQIRDYLNQNTEPHLLALVSVNDNKLLFNGFLLGTFSEGDFDEYVEDASEGLKNPAEI
jgi:Leucine-rich repeat (LRR) protein